MDEAMKEVSSTKKRISDARSLLNESEDRLKLLREKASLYLLPEQPPVSETKSEVSAKPPANTSPMEDELEELKAHIRRVIAKVNEIINRVR